MDFVKLSYGILLIGSFAFSSAAHAKVNGGITLWQKAKSGMSESTIKKLYPNIIEGNADFSSSHTFLRDDNYKIGSCKTELSFEFSNNSLLAVTISLEDDFNPECQASLYGSIKTKYGSPTKVSFLKGIRNEEWDRGNGVFIDVIGGSFPALNKYNISIIYHRDGSEDMENKL